MRQHAAIATRATLEVLEVRRLLSGALDGASAVSLGVDGSGVVHVAYHDPVDATLSYVSRSAAGTWSVPTTIDGNELAGTRLSLALKADGTPAVAYYDAANRDLKYAEIGGTGWAVRTVDRKGDVGRNPSLAFDRKGRALISYYAADKQDLRLATQKGAKWQVKAVDTRGRVGQYSSLAVSPKDGSWGIAYEVEGSRQIRLLRNSKKVNVATLNPAADWASRPSLAFGPDGSPTVAYVDPAAGELEVAALVKVGRKQVWQADVAGTGLTSGTEVRAQVHPATGKLMLAYVLPGGTVNVATLTDGAWASSSVGTGTVPAAALDPTTGGLYVLAGGTLVPVDTSLSAPGNLTAEASPIAEVTLNWSDPSGGLAGFRIERAAGAGSTAFAALGATPPGLTTYTDATAAEGVTYTYRVSTVKGSAASLATAQATVSVGKFAPTNLTATPASATSVNLAWTDVSGGRTGFRVERAPAGGAYAALATVPAGTTTYADHTVAEGRSYVYRVYATKGPVASATAPTAAVTVPTEAPADLSAAVTPPSITLTWTDRSQAETGFSIERSSDGTAWSAVGTAPTNATQYVDSAVTVGAGYFYRVIAVRPGGNTPASNVVQVAASGAPATPTALAAKAVSDTEVVLTWERADARETSLTVWRSVAGGPFSPMATLPAASNIYLDGSCYPATVYAYRVTAENADGSSPPSPAVAATTKASVATQPAATGLAAVATSPQTVTLTWTDPITAGRTWFVERSVGGFPYAVVAVVPGTGTTGTYADAQLSPQTGYSYRVRAATWVGNSDYSGPAAVTTPARPAGTPLEPAGVSATVNSGTSVTLAWADTNLGAASYVIETAPFSWVDSPAWQPAGETAGGATGYTLTTTPETFYYVRVRARTAAGDSGYSQRLSVRTASPGTPGGPKDYHVGPGEAYASLGAVDWSALGPGDTVYVHPNRDVGGSLVPYHEKPMISTRGTAAAPVRVVGVPDSATGALPVIDGTNAVAHAQWDRAYMPIGDLSLVLIAARSEQTSGGWSPGHLSLENLEIRNGYDGDPGDSPRTYTAWDGSTRAYAAAWGVYIEKGDHITIRGCDIHGNNGGVFGAGQGDNRNLEALTLDSNRIRGNGTVNSYLEHNTYLEGVDTVYQSNEYGPLRAGSLGGGLKDRGAGTVIRYNTIRGGGHLVDLVETQNYYQSVLTLPSYHETSVYGNTFYNTGSTYADGSITPIHYGGDQDNAMAYRKGVLHFYNNTFVNQMDRSQQWRVTLFAVRQGSGVVDARNNAIYVRPDATQTPPEFSLLPTDGTAYFGRNWVSPAVNVSRPDQPFVGHAAGTGHFLTNAENDPGFVDFAAADYRPAVASPLVDQGLRVAAGVPPVLLQHAAWDGVDRSVPRGIVGAAADVGAFEAGDAE